MVTIPVSNCLSWRAPRFWGVVFAATIVLVVAVESPAKEKPAGPPPFESIDKDGNGFLSKEEFLPRFPQSLFQRIDANSDGKISRKEDDNFRARRRQGAGRQAGGKAPENALVDIDIVYETVGGRDLHLDLYRPKNATKPTPLVIWVHGGGWRGGSKKGACPALALLQRGYAVASVEYRLSGEAIFPAAIEDCKAAVSFLRLHAKEYKLDPKRFGAWGASAGGHLVAMLGTTGDVDLFDTHPVAKKASSAVQAVCDWFGPSDFLRMNDVRGGLDHDAASSPESKFIGGAIQENKDKVQRANPITYVSRADPPFLIVHGDADRVVIYGQSELLQAALEKAKVESTLYRVKNGGHGFGGASESREALVELATEFFDKVLKE